MIIFTSFQLTMFQIFILVGPGLLLAFGMNLVAGGVEKRAFRILGRRMYLWLFGWLGTSVHEMGHALMCVLFRHKIHRIELFNPNPDSHSLGCVEHSYHPRNLYQIIGNFFIGIGPILLGTTVIYISACFLLSERLPAYFEDLQVSYQVMWDLKVLQALGQDTYLAFGNFLADTFTADNLKRWQLYLFCYLLFCIGSSMKLSVSDIKSALQGFVAMVCLLFLANFILALLEYENVLNNVSLLASYLSVFYTAMLFTLILNLLLLALLSIAIGVIQAIN